MPEKAKPAVASGGHRGITVSNWKPLQKGGLRGFLTLTLPSGLILNNCQLLETKGQRWIGLPSQRFQLKDGSIGYVPIVEFTTKRARKQLQSEALHAVELYLAEAGYVL
jgi:DNA-binding cell septation regulator SpoVG